VAQVQIKEQIIALEIMALYQVEEGQVLDEVV
jgi:hypothetical protein